MSALLAVLLLASAIAPPAIRHTHEWAQDDGIHHPHPDVAYSAKQGDGHGKSEHRHGGTRDDRGANSHRRSVELRRASLWHLHVHWFGFEFTLRDPDSTLPNPGSNQSGRKEHAEQQMRALAPNQNSLFCQMKCSAVDDYCVGRIALPSMDDARATQFAPATPAPVLCAPLCDRARHERSGVLLV